MRDASAWELVNIPVDDAIDLFDSLHQAIAESEQQKQVTFDINQEMRTQLEKLGEHHSNIT